jgi:hypothetical protein
VIALLPARAADDAMQFDLVAPSQPIQIFGNAWKICPPYHRGRRTEEPVDWAVRQDVLPGRASNFANRLWLTNGEFPGAILMPLSRPGIEISGFEYLLLGPAPPTMRHARSQPGSLPALTLVLSV